MSRRRNKTIGDFMTPPQRRSTPCPVCDVSTASDTSVVLVLHHRDRDPSNNKAANHKFPCTVCHSTRHLVWSPSLQLWVYHPGSLTPPDLLEKLDARRFDGGMFVFLVERTRYKIVSGCKKILPV
jgi:hypothetical protein